MQNPRYLARSWAMLTDNRGWIKPVLVLTAARFVPIVGGMGTEGYALEWARLTAWGVDASAKQKGVDIPACIVSGFRALVVSLAISLLVGIPTGVMQAGITTVTSFMGDSIAGFVAFLLAIVVGLITFLSTFVIIIAQLRAAIYEKLSAAFSISNIYAMIRRDFNGFLRIIGIHLVFGLIAFVFITAFMILLGIILAPIVVSASRGGEADIMRALAGACIPLALVSVPFAFLFSMLSVVSRLVQFNAVGLWFRQFNVPEWGSPDDPLPGTEASSEADSRF